MASASNEFVLTLSCPDSKGIVHAVSGWLFKAGHNIIDSQQFGDILHKDSTGLFFMRVHFSVSATDTHIRALEEQFAPIATSFGMQTAFYNLAHKPRILVMVSKHDHCLNDLLFRWRSGWLPVEIVAIVSNHPDFAPLAQSYGVAFHHWSLQPGSDAHTKRQQEEKIESLIDAEKIDFLVLARYMQILSPAFCNFIKGRAINIHHSFLPSFKGAKPYYQAHDRGVKLIGATAHFVTQELDEGPIIEQDVVRVDHTQSPEDLTALGRDAECLVLARAVKWHAEHRVFINGHKTLVFR